MNVDELKKNLHDVIERYRDKAEFTGEVRRDVMARDCLQVVEELEAENEQLKKDLEHARSYKHTMKMRNRNLQTENERLKAELQQSATKCNKLRYALALLRWEHAHHMETMIDLRYTVRPSSWRFYYKSKTYWFNKWQELKKELKEVK